MYAGTDLLLGMRSAYVSNCFAYSGYKCFTKNKSNAVLQEMHISEQSGVVDLNFECKALYGMKFIRVESVFKRSFLRPKIPPRTLLCCLESNAGLFIMQDQFLVNYTCKFFFLFSFLLYLFIFLRLNTHLS